LYGDKVTPDNTTLLEWARRAGVLDRCSFLGREPAVERRLPGLDLLVSSSLSEAFPLILGEAMACGVLCVTTDAGDSAVIVGDPARVVPRNNPVALADAIVRAVQLDAGRQAADAASAVEHIRTQFALPQIAARFRALYTELAGAQLSLAANDATS
jgi:glycosyltransferase involved in cell wall biosynthesis